MRRLLLAAALALAGCGGGSGGSGVSEQSYQQQGTAICSRYQAQIAKLGAPTRVKQLGPYITRALPILTRTVAELGRIRPPSARQDAFAKYLAAARATLSRATALRAAAAKADGNEVQRLLGEAAAASTPRATLAQAAGLNACSLS